MNIILSGNGPSNNRGCAAIYLGTRAILQAEFPGCRFVVASFGNDPELGIASCDQRVSLSPIIRRGNAEWWARQYRRVFRRGEDLTDAANVLESEWVGANALLSLGGDNYAIDYGYEIVERLMRIDERAAQKGLPTVIWGASIGPFDRDPAFERRILAHLAKTNLVVIRDTESLDYLSSHGITQNVVLAPDPSFAMQPEAFGIQPVLRGVLEQGCIGANLSPLLAKYATHSSLADAYSLGAEIVGRIVAAFGMPVVLIPHVGTGGGNPMMDDHHFLKEVFSRIKGRAPTSVLLAPTGMTAPQVKWLISRLRLFVGARTHSTLAAFSTGVPCVSIVYSRKGAGINRWLFGHERWTVSAASLSSANVERCVAELLQQEIPMRTHLASFGRQAKEDVFALGKAVRRVIESKPLSRPS